MNWHLCIGKAIGHLQVSVTSGILPVKVDAKEAAPAASQVMVTLKLRYGQLWSSRKTEDEESGFANLSDGTHNDSLSQSELSRYSATMTSFKTVMHVY